MQKFFLITVLFFLPFASINAAEMKLAGNYYGDNIFIDNPSIGGAYCVKALTVNGKSTHTVIASNTFEINLSILNLEYGTPVIVIIKHADNCAPTILNPDALIEKCGFTLVNSKQDKKTEELTFSITNQKSTAPYIIEQYRWSRWIEVGKIDVALNADTVLYKFKPTLNSGNNLFRIKQKAKREECCYSADIKAKSPLREITFMYDKKVNNLTFNAATYYEIYDKSGKLLKSGNSKVIDLSDLTWDVYILNYDNSTIQVFL